MEDKEFKRVYGRKKKAKNKTAVRYKFINKKKGIWRIPDNF